MWVVGGVGGVVDWPLSPRLDCPPPLVGLPPPCLIGLGRFDLFGPMSIKNIHLCTVNVRTLSEEFRCFPPSELCDDTIWTWPVGAYPPRRCYTRQIIFLDELINNYPAPKKFIAWRDPGFENIMHNNLHIPTARALLLPELDADMPEHTGPLASFTEKNR